MKFDEMGLDYSPRLRWAAVAGVIGVCIAAIVIGGCVTRPAPAPAPPPAPRPKPPAPKPLPPPAPETPPPVEPATTTSNPMLKIRIAAGQRAVILESSAAMTATAAQNQQALSAGRWQVKLTSGTPARYRYGAYVKGYKPYEQAEADAAVQAWRAQGFQAGMVTLGQINHATDGRTLDGRSLWVNVGHFPTQQEADAIKKLLERQGQSVWVRPELMEPGKGSITLAGPQGSFTAQTPLRIKGSAAIYHVNHPDGQARSYTGELEFQVDQDGDLGVYEHIDMETYLTGVLPSEMPALWPDEALKAQAVAARSDVLKHMNEKRILEGYHFLATVADRAYNGAGGRHPRTDAAVAATRGEVATDGYRILPGVFSSNCGGWTDANETAWTGPPDATLRPVQDAPGVTASAPMSVTIDRWLTQRGNAYCAADDTGYRWTKTLSQADVTRLVNQKYNVGTVQRIQLGDRGPGGRLLSVTVTGSKGSATIARELPIRQAFGGLPSAMFIINGGQSASGSAYTFKGGGRGHGVGMCQHGARGMADSGADYRTIIKHYYTGASIVALK